MTLEEAQLEIDRLNNELAIARQVKGDRVIVSNFVEGSVDILDTEVPFADFKKEDGSYHTITTFCEANNRAVELNSDGTRFIFAYELSDLDNVYDSLKELLRDDYGLVGGGSDFTNVGDELFWVLNYSELQRFRGLNPKWNNDI